MVLAALYMGNAGLCPSLAAQASPGAKSALVDAVIEAHGGADRISGIRSLRLEGMLVAVNGGNHGKLYRISQGEGTLSMMVEYPDRIELRILEDGRGWRGDGPATLAEVQGPLLGAMVLQSARAFLPMVLADHRDDTVLEHSDSTTAVLTVTLTPELSLRLWMDPDTHLITRSESILAAGPMTIAFATDYADYRMVDGVAFPFREQTFAQGVPTASTLIESVEINPEGPRTLLPIPEAR